MPSLDGKPDQPNPGQQKFGAQYKLIGKDYKTPDLYAKVTGKAKYAEDFRAEGMLFCKLLLSPVPHGRVKDLDLGPPPEDLWVASKDGTRIHSFVLRPPGLAKGKAAPLTVLIHGGPQGSWEDSWGMRWNEAAFAARGHVVVAIDPHGSIGYGQKFVIRGEVKSLLPDKQWEKATIDFQGSRTRIPKPPTA